MNINGTKVSRREQILAALAKMLEDSPGERITTSALAKTVGVSEAALYRHFPSKTKMFEGLIEFTEETVAAKISEIVEEQKSPLHCCELIVGILIRFAEEHPGLSRLLVGDALTGETARLRKRIVQFFENIEGQLKSLLDGAEIQRNGGLKLSAAALAHFLMAYADGVIVQFVRSEFQTSPSAHWREQWLGFSSLLMHAENR